MFKIAICDDEKEMLERTERLLQKYQSRRDYIEMQIKPFRSSFLLEEKITEGTRYDLYILDMVMPERTGIDLGKLIREYDSDAVIIYLTSSPDFALDAYQVLAQRYLLKPVQEEELYAALDYAVMQSAMSEKFFVMKTPQGTVRMNLKEIIYVESASRTMRVNLADGSEVTSICLRKSFEDGIGELLDSGEFVQIHKSYLVRLDKIKRMQQGSLLLEGDVELPISKNRQTEVKRIYMKFTADYYR